MTLHELIREAWANACHNGDEAQLRAWSAYTLACDMFDCDAEIGKYEFEDVVDAVNSFVAAGYQ